MTWKVINCLQLVFGVVEITWTTIDDLNNISNVLNRLLKNVMVVYSVNKHGYVDLELRDRNGRLIRILGKGLKRREAYRVMEMMTVVIGFDAKNK